MAQRISSSTITSGGSKLYENTAAGGNLSLYPNVYSTPDAENTTSTQYQNSAWTNELGAYMSVSELAGMIDRKAQFVVGKGYIQKGTQKKDLSKITGNGLDSFNTIMYNAVRVFTIGGDFFAEIIRNKRGELRNLKPLNPGQMRTIANSRGIITGYELVPFGDLGIEKKAQHFEPEEIFHLAYNRIADCIHGQSIIEKLMPIINMRQEAMNDLRIVFHRYVKPLWIFSVDTDDQAQVTAFKNKVDATIEKAENLVVPKDTVASIERISIPQFSTLDPVPWVQLLQKEFLKAEGIPSVVMGAAGASESESKILYLAFQQVVEFNQMFLEEQIKLQLGLEVSFEFPASITPDIVSNQNKSPAQNKFGVIPGRDSK
jgi:hypothetical protein